jgi:hypothetical protein
LKRNVLILLFILLLPCASSSSSFSSAPASSPRLDSTSASWSLSHPDSRNGKSFTERSRQESAQQQRGGGGGDRNSQIKKFLKNVGIHIVAAKRRRKRRSKFPNQEIPQERWNPRSRSEEEEEEEENPHSNSNEEEEEEIKIPKSINSSRTLRTWAAATRRRRRRSKFPNQEIPQLTRPPPLSTKHTIHIYYKPAPQGTGSDWKNLLGTAHIDKHKDIVALIYKM